MATSSNVLCGICDAQHITKCADVWCPECEEGLCVDCQKHHSLSKATRNHGIIPVDQYQKLPSSISEVVRHCNDHGMKYTNYCQEHDTLCCPDCISTTHAKCTDYLSVEQIIKNAKTSKLLDNMEQSLNDADNIIEKVIVNRKHNLSDLRQQRQNLHDEMTECRFKISSHLDAMKESFIEELNAAEIGARSKIESLLLSLNKEQKTTQKLKNTISALKEHASDLQTAFGSKTFQPDVVKAEKYIESLSENGCLNRLNLKCSFNNVLLEALEQITSLGSLSIETGPPTLVIKTKKDKPAQITDVIQQSSPKSVNDIELSFLHSYNIPTPGGLGYRGCVFYSSDALILTQRSDCKLIVLNNDGKVDKDIPCSSYVNDVTTIDDKTVAVSTNNGIQIINIDSKQIKRVIKTSNWCYGITHHKGTLLVCVRSTGIQRIDLSNGNITTVVNQDIMPWDCYLTTYGDKIYHTNWQTKTVTCYTIDGKKQWEYSNDAILMVPKCVTVDNNCYVYVTSTESNCVSVLTPDGKEGRQLLTESDGLKRPWGICFERTKNKVSIVNRKGSAFLYQIT